MSFCGSMCMANGTLGPRQTKILTELLGLCKLCMLRKPSTASTALLALESTKGARGSVGYILRFRLGQISFSTGTSFYCTGFDEKRRGPA